MTESKLRKCINYIRTNGLLPVIADDNGYYITNDPIVIRDMAASLRRRTASINAAAGGLEELARRIDPKEDPITQYVNKHNYGRNEDRVTGEYIYVGMRRKTTTLKKEPIRIMTFEDKELIDYNDYMNFIREEISIECKTKFTLTSYEPTPDEIEIKHITTDSCDGRWSITYSVYYPHPVMNVLKKIPGKMNKIHGMSKKASFEQWKAIKIANDRDEKLKQLGI